VGAEKARSTIDATQRFDAFDTLSAGTSLPLSKSHTADLLLSILSKGEELIGGGALR
jgi:hypothetical protein